MTAYTGCYDRKEEVPPPKMRVGPSMGGCVRWIREDLSEKVIKAELSLPGQGNAKQ